MAPITWDIRVLVLHAGSYDAREDGDNERWESTPLIRTYLGNDEC